MGVYVIFGLFDKFKKQKRGDNQKNAHIHQISSSEVYKFMMRQSHGVCAVGKMRVT